MPLQHSSSPKAFKQNVRTLMGEVGKSPHVQSPQQALAISYDIKRRAKRDAGGAVDPVSAVITALQSGSNQVASPGSNPGMNSSTPTPAAAAQSPAGATVPTPLPTNAAPTTSQQITGAPLPDQAIATPVTTAVPANTGLGTSNPLASAPVAGLQNQPQVQNGIGGKPLGMAFGGMPGAGIGQMPWYVRAESRELNHTGPVMSAVPGRTDRHNVSVPSSSYVFPADFVSHLGQNNSQAGMKILGNMGFGSGGPPAGMKMPHGMGAPKPPHMMGIPGDAGGRKGAGHIGTPTPVVIAGGEFVAPPEAIMKVLKTTDMRHAHKTLDAWVMKVRKDHIKTLRGLPPPEKA